MTEFVCQLFFLAIKINIIITIIIFIMHFSYRSDKNVTRFNASALCPGMYRSSLCQITFDCTFDFSLKRKR